VEVLDAAYWVKGCSSLGRLRFAIVLGVGKKSKRSHCLMDVKEATDAAAPSYRRTLMPKCNAERVVKGARRLAPHLGERMLATRLFDRSVFLRELLPQDLKLEIERLTFDEAMEIGRYLASIVPSAHGRQMDAHSAADLAKRASTKSVKILGCTLIANVERRRARGKPRSIWSIAGAFPAHRFECFRSTLRAPLVITKVIQ
jgi:uncharacterized protein (DUF2252 family)